MYQSLFYFTLTATPRTDLLEKHIISNIIKCVFAGLNHEQNMKKMRLLTFMQLAEGTTEMSFETIQQELQLNENQVEAFIIDGASNHFIIFLQHYFYYNLEKTYIIYRRQC